LLVIVYVFVCEYDGTGCRLTIFRIASKGGMGTKENPVEFSRRTAVELAKWKGGLACRLQYFAFNLKSKV